MPIQSDTIVALDEVLGNIDRIVFSTMEKQADKTLGASSSLTFSDGTFEYGGEKAPVELAINKAERSEILRIQISADIL